MLPQLYPNLFAETSWGTVSLNFELRDAPPPNHLISNINVVPFVGDRCVVIRFMSGEWEMPGGTLEPGETYMDAARRELMEEAGARLLTLQTFGAWRCHSSEPEPYRPHLPHPDFYRLAAYGQVELVGAPLNPEGGEHVVSVESLPVEEAVRLFIDSGRPDLAELYKLAATLYEETGR